MLYTVDDLPPGANAAAFLPMPPPTVTNPASSSWGLISSREMAALNAAQPAPSAAAIPPNSEDPMTQPGQVYKWWSPIIYVAYPVLSFARSTQLRHSEDLPVPAINPNKGQQAPVGQRRPFFLGRRQVPWPRAFQRFPSVGGNG